MHDIPVAVLRQTELPRHDVPAAIRASLVVKNTGILIAMLLVPVAYAIVPVAVVIAGCAAVITAIGIVGLTRFASAGPVSSLS